MLLERRRSHDPQANPSVEAKGYTDVHDIEIDDGRYEVDARNSEGHAVDLELDMKTLEIVHEKLD